MTTILEALENANYNIDNVAKVGIFLLPLVKEQLNNAITLLNKGYDLEDTIDDLLEKYETVEKVPYKEDI